MRYVVIVVLVCLVGLAWAQTTNKVTYQLWEYRECTAEFGTVMSVPCYRKEPVVFLSMDDVLSYLNGTDDPTLGRARPTATSPTRRDKIEVERCETLVLTPQITEKTYTVPARTETEKTYQWVKPIEFKPVE